MKFYRCTASALIVRSLPRIGADTDTGLRLINNHQVIAYGESFDEKWVWGRSSVGEGWSSLLYLIESSPEVVPSWVVRPHGLTGIRETFGLEGNLECSMGRVTFPAPIGAATRFACHRLVAPIFQSVFNEIYRRGLWSLLKTWDGCYNVRRKTGTSSKWSTHSWGIAFDVNAGTNGFGKVPTLDQRIVGICKDHQLVWGGDWSTPDGMHFQYASGY